MTDMNNKVDNPVKNKSSGFKSKYEKIQKILESRRVKRESWPQDKRDNYVEFLERLKKAHDSYVQALKDKIIECAENVLKKNPKAKSFKLWDPQNIQCDLNGFKEFTVYRGFWNAEKKKHDRLPHMEAGIKSTPLVQVSRDLKSDGYVVKDVSNASLSLHIVVEVYIVSNKEDTNETEETPQTI